MRPVSSHPKARATARPACACRQAGKPLRSPQSRWCLHQAQHKDSRQLSRQKGPGVLDPQDTQPSSTAVQGSQLAGGGLRVLASSRTERGPLRATAPGPQGWEVIYHLSQLVSMATVFIPPSELLLWLKIKQNKYSQIPMGLHFGLNGACLSRGNLCLKIPRS